MAQQGQWQQPARSPRRRMPAGEKITIITVIAVIVAALVFLAVTVAGPVSRMFGSEFQYVQTLQTVYGVTSANHNITENRLTIVLNKQMLTCTAPPYKTVQDHQPFDCDGVTVRPTK